MCRFKVVLSFLLYQRVIALSIDQRQTGDLNVQIDLKNFKVLALTKGKEDYVDYDYAYDYSEMTIKPQNGTTNTTIKPLHTTEASLLTGNNATLTESVSTTEKIVNISSYNTTEPTATMALATATDVLSSTAVTTIVTNAHDTPHNTTPHGLSTTADNLIATNLPDCKKGFYRNIKGNCELRLQNPSNELFKMLQQKTKRGNAVRKT